MPISPFRRAVEEGAMSVVPTGRQEGPTHGKKKRKARQRKRKEYQILREELQLSGDIPTTPEGAIRSEVVDPSTQGAQPMPELVAAAIRKGWAVPEGNKVELIDEMVKIALHPEIPAKQKVAAFNALRMADRSQWEQDNPVDAGKAKGGATTTIHTSVQSNMLAVSVLREMLENELGGGETGLPTPTEPSPPSHSRFDGQVEVGAASTGYQPDTGEGLANTKQSDSDYRPIPTR